MIKRIGCLMLILGGASTMATAAQDSGSAEQTASSDSVGQLIAIFSTEKGDIYVQLFADQAPVTVASFANLAERGYYDGLKFHRVINDFMIQGGDPTGTGRSGPGYTFEDETTPALLHDGPGVLSMANSGPATNGSQFFITHRDTSHLNGKHTIFGRVVEGQDVVNKIAQNDVMEAVIIDGDTTKLFAAQKTRIDEWNTKLDAKFPGRSSAISGDKWGAIEKKLPDIRKQAVVRWASLEAGAKEAGEAFAVQTKVTEECRSKGTKTDSGLVYQDITVGEGESPKPTQMVALHCKGWLESGKTFYDTHDGAGKPLRNLASGFVPGFNEALASMKIGGKRIMVIPGDLGYGTRGQPAAGIGPNATIIFEVELLEIN